MSGSKPDPCKNFACALQKCLQANDYQEWKCTSVMEALYECCAKAGTESLVCSGIHPKKTDDGTAAFYKPHISEESASSS